MRRTVVGVLVAISVAGGVGMMPGAAFAAPPSTTRVVDDDGAQCGRATYRSIGAAVAAASPGDTVRVCAGVYRERVDVTKPLRLMGQQDAIDGLVCVDESWTSGTPVDPSRFAVVEPPDAAVAPLVRLRADGVELAGLVVRGQVDPGNDQDIYAPAIQADGAYSGHRIHHNLVQDNTTLGVELGSNGATLSQVDHNCLRGNRWAVATQRYSAINIRVDHNEAFRSQYFSYEASTFASLTEGPLLIRAARFDHNRAVGDGYDGFAIEGVQASQFDHNSVEAPGRNAISLGGGNKDVTLSENVLSGPAPNAVGIRFLPPGPAAPVPSTDVVLARNRASGFAVGILVALNARTTATQVLDNVTSDNRIAGIQVGPTNVGVLVRGNSSDRNDYGIRTSTPAVTGNTFVDNSMHGNRVFDAQDSSFTTSGGLVTLGNTWTGNRCDTDSPPGTICGR